MAEKARRRRRRTLLVPLLGLGVAAWVVRRRLTEPHGPDTGWQPLPPRPVVPRFTDTPAPVDDVVTASAPAEDPVPAPVAVDEPVASTADTPEAVERPRARAVPTASAVASVTAPVLPEPVDTPFGPGSLRALADGSSPDPTYTIKGKAATKVFHAPGGAYYTRTRADVWFRSARDARGAGFTERVRRTD
jgi:hypothetical protein